jgi:hypothetical protein
VNNISGETVGDMGCRSWGGTDWDGGIDIFTKVICIDLQVFSAFPGKEQSKVMRRQGKTRPVFSHKP